MRKLRFYFNRNLDKFMAAQFLDEKMGGIDFGVNIVKLHPLLRSSKKDRGARKKTLDKYFKQYYRSHRREMSQKASRIKEAWRDVEDEFVITTERLLGGFRFPSGRYIAYPSIVDCNPRFLVSKTFQFYYRKVPTDAVHTIAHELLHFIFFAFVKSRLKNAIKKLPEEKLWDLSELFNVIILQSPSYRKLINPHYAHPYPDHQKYVSRFETAYRKSRAIEEFIRNGIAIIK